MWKPFVDGNVLYLLQFKKVDGTFSFLVTNFSLFWKCDLTDDELVSNFKVKNPLIDATPDQIISNFLAILENFKNLVICTEKIDDKLQVIFEKNCDNNRAFEQKLTYTIALQKLRERDTSEDNEFMVSSLKTIYLLEKQKQMLVNLVEKKDRELEEYRMEKGEISRSDLKTEKFNPQSLQVNNNNFLLNIFTNEQHEMFWKQFTQNHGDIETENLHIELEPWNVKPKKRVIHNGKNIVKKGSGVVFKKAKNS
ncbi:uncharacterized protein LOC126734001 isoform X2 [Anthonomus grandis grandis]|uniref:uncharacterized protein LOC126734001 isoform X2 n=1 Tax=Anthonomus grandis grandis TaxID=2921223 RepID=UPI0021662327|nr:uncharacterized protein LOC126734001 isoform X2 [Anthonomus grandis grandis]